MEYIVINGELYHHGVKGQKWGVRRYQNKDGSLTPAGKKRLAKDLKKDYWRNRNPGTPYVTSTTYKKKLTDAIEKVITSDDKKRIATAREQWRKSAKICGEADDALYAEAAKHGKKMYEDELRKNPDLYETPRDKQKLLDYMTYDKGVDKAKAMRPDLAKTSKEAGEKLIRDYLIYEDACQRVCDKMLGEYGNTKLYEDRYNTLTIKKTVGHLIDSMDQSEWKKG